VTKWCPCCKKQKQLSLFFGATKSVTTTCNPCIQKTNDSKKKHKKELQKRIPKINEKFCTRCNKGKDMETGFKPGYQQCYDCHFGKPGSEKYKKRRYYFITKCELILEHRCWGYGLNKREEGKKCIHGFDIEDADNNFMKELAETLMAKFKLDSKSVDLGLLVTAIQLDHIGRKNQVGCEKKQHNLSDWTAPLCSMQPSSRPAFHVLSPSLFWSLMGQFDS
jgi:hypothetical protein